MKIQEHQRGDFLISTDKARLDIDAVHAYLTRSYWANGIPRHWVARSIEGSLCFGVYQADRQIGFARVISDFTTYGYLADVYVLEEFQGQGLGKWLMECIMSHPELQDFRRFSLSTSDAHGLYSQFGFKAPAHPDRLMEILNSDVYKHGGPRERTN